MKKRLAIYMTYDSEGIVDDYIVYMLKAVRSVCDDTIVVSNTYLSETQKQKLMPSSRIYERNNSGFDVGAYGEVITTLCANKELDKYEELVLLNDSVFGPFYDLIEMFDEMDKRSPQADFWGVTRRGTSDFDGGEEIYPEHIQSYCYIFRDKIMHSNDFLNYWNKISMQVTDFRSAILNYEFRLTHYFVELGYTWDSYCKCSEYITSNPRNNLSPYHYGSFELIKRDRCPFLKRKLFTGDFIENKYTDARDLREAVNYINQNTKYDVDLMWEYVLRKYEISKIIKSMQMIDVISSELSLPMVNIDDVYIVDVDGNIAETTSTATFLNCKYILLLVSDNNDIVSLSKAHNDNLKYNLCYNKTYIHKLVQLFEQEKRLGAIIPPIDVYGKISNVYNSVKNSLYKIRGFMCRKSLISNKMIRDMEKDISGYIVSTIPKIAQEAGYYTKIVINIEYVNTWMTNSMMISDLMMQLNAGTDNKNMDIDEIQNAYYKKEICNFVNKNKKIYIYGAGQLAYKVMNMIENLSHIEGFIVSDINGNSKKIKNLPVFCFNDFSAKDCGIIVAVGKKNNETVTNKLQERGFLNYLVLD